MKRSRAMLKAAPELETACSPAIKDYLKVIYLLQQEHPRVTTSVLAHQVGVKPASASGMIQRLAKLNLVTYIPYHGVVLTDLGERTARDVLQRCCLVARFLVAALEYSWEEAHVEANVMEPAISQTLEARMMTWLGQSCSC